MSVKRVITDYALLVGALALSIFGIAMVYSAGQTDVPFTRSLRSSAEE